MDRNTTANLSDGVQKNITVKEAYIKAVEYFNAQRYSEAEYLCNAILHTAPKHVDSLNILGVIAQRVDRNDIAVELFQRAIGINENYGVLYHNLGISYNQLQNYHDAAAAFNSALDKSPENAQIHVDLGTVFENLKNFDEAVVNYQKAISINPNFAKAFFNLGNVKKNQGKLDEAVAHYEKAISINPRLAEVYCNLGNVKKDLGKFDEAVANYHKAIAINPGYINAINNLGNVLVKLGKFDEAVHCLQNVITLKPDLTDGYYNLGLALIKQNNKKAAAEIFKKGLLNIPDCSEELLKLGDAIKERIIDKQINIPCSDNRSSLSNADSGSKVDFIADLSDLERLEQAYRQAERDLPLQAEQPYDFQGTLEGFYKNIPRDPNDKSLRILLLQPPLWRMSEPGEPPYPPEEGGPPNIYKLAGIVDETSTAITYGLLSIAAQILHSGKKVLVVNLSTFSWKSIVGFIQRIDIDLVGITCMTHNYRSVPLLSKLIKDTHPKAHVVVGGEHSTTLPKEMLKYCPDIDTVVIGEGENTFLEIIDCLEKGQPVQNIAGTGWRDGDKVKIISKREKISDLNTLASAHNYFPINYLLTSRGCPFSCTFCSSSATWGRKIRRNSMDYTMELLEKIVLERKITQVRINDDTLTASRSKALAFCDEIIARKLNFFWVCNTRADCLNEDMLRAMRLAGCKRIYMGVESGSPAILETINKGVGPDRVIDVTKSAAKYGIEVFYYMIAGNRNETLETFGESVKLLVDAKPCMFAFTYLQLLPGTQELDIYKKENNLTSDFLFDSDYYVFKYGFFDYVKGSLQEIIPLWIQCYDKCGEAQFFTVEESQAVLERLDGYHAAHMDLAGSYLRAGQPDQAELHVWQGFNKGYPIVDLVYNYLAIIAAFRGDFKTVDDYLQKAKKINPNTTNTTNSNRYNAWVAAGGTKSGKDLQLIVFDEFGINMAEKQPCLPGPLNIY
ncbi:MAG: tetratricopeptide repeat protein [Magnetococcales bacterium]|nr:tetratricopeptide repeat protein [Magnetococcales bacterium]